MKKEAKDDSVDLWKTVVRFLFAALFIVAGLVHSLCGPMLLQFMPRWLPSRLLLIYISGAFEILGGIGLVYPPVRKAAGVGLALLLLAVFPVNICMALNPHLAREWGAPLFILWLRLPLQFVLIGLVLWCSRKGPLISRNFV